MRLPTTLSPHVKAEAKPQSVAIACARWCGIGAVEANQNAREMVTTTSANITVARLITSSPHANSGCFISRSSYPKARGRSRSLHHLGRVPEPAREGGRSGKQKRQIAPGARTAHRDKTKRPTAVSFAAASARNWFLRASSYLANTFETSRPRPSSAAILKMRLSRGHDKPANLTRRHSGSALIDTSTPSENQRDPIAFPVLKERRGTGCPQWQVTLG
jgi:hypothetical protein